MTVQKEATTGMQVERIEFKRIHVAPAYLQELCSSTLNAQRRGNLHSSKQAEQQHRALSVAGPAIWNGIPVALRLVLNALPTTFMPTVRLHRRV